MQEELRLRFRQASRSIRRILTPPCRRSSDQRDFQGDSAVHRRRHVIHHDSDAQENQGAGVDLMESIQVESAQMDQSQLLMISNLPPPQQNQESQESTSQRRSWQRIRSCFSVSVSLSSASWKKSESGKESRRDQTTIITSLSASTKSHGILLVLFSLLRFVILLFNSLRPSDQSSVQSLSAQPSVTAAISRVSARLALGSSLMSLLSPLLASFKQIASLIMSMASALKEAQDATSACITGSAYSSSRRCGHAVSGCHNGHQKSRLRLSLHFSGQKSHCQTSLKVSSYGYAHSIVKVAVKSCLPISRMDHVSLVR